MMLFESVTGTPPSTLLNWNISPNLLLLCGVIFDFLVTQSFLSP